MKHIILIGFMGAGKTTLGKALAQECGLPFVDTDERIVQQQNREINDIFQKEGESFFRQLETQQLRTLVQEARSVVSVGGGLPVQPQNQPLLRELGETIYLKASKETLLERLQGSENRPLLKGGELKQKIETLMAERESIYERTADRIVVTDQKTPEEVIEELKHITGKEGLEDE